MKKQKTIKTDEIYNMLQKNNTTRIIAKQIVYLCELKSIGTNEKINVVEEILQNAKK